MLSAFYHFPVLFGQQSEGPLLIQVVAVNYDGTYDLQLSDSEGAVGSNL